ncbi:MAG: ATPase [Deltaproteobacteria bacterium CG_4_10_14_0_2_um_filter_43_8]|nr:MAG: ATPase [Deltaproteobacteria bacterium CG11_big_fil_rev_8_21_14_0_20_42_23]PJA19563.1 MAG: ATPase [Deltaproteobacteria bacterium CG_4_10_14_0_2_um_filter_43_8]PJC63938.1 MAG: ATPase [Deltaproteobacteria bacterium CG_4_9_14_0_2_um_filter_42_21]
MFSRLFNPSKSQSFFLFGARGTGKSTLLEQLFSPDEVVVLDLLNFELAQELMSYPNNLLHRLDPYKGKKPWVIIDEVQKVPALLDLVHKLIQKKQFKFALTGSSARKLKRGAANLLAGRAFVYHLFPLTVSELQKSFSLYDVLKFGSLPEIFSFENEPDKARFLKAYTETYLKEEIITEQIIRKLPPFRRFLDVAAQMNAEVINYSNIAKDIHSDPKTVSGYYDILEDTLLGFRLLAYHTSLRKQQKKAPKFYFFDPGVVRALAGQVDYDLSPQSFEYGQLFETFIINEFHRRLTYQEKQFKLSYLRINDELEIDLIIERGNFPPALIEIKSAQRVDERHAKSLITLGADVKKAKHYLISNDPEAKQFSHVQAYHWKEALDRILEKTEPTT